MIQIPGYRLVRELGSGASGTVHLAVQEALERSVAVKILAPGLFDAEQTRARFEREAKVQARLDHPNLLRVLDAGFAGDTPYLVMELVEGGSLRDRLDKQGRLPAAEAVSVAAAIASGLAHAHAMGIVHRDLKPENVLFTGEGLAQVADFGLAKTSTAGESVRTATGIILGTPGYMAPEVLCGEAAGQAADVYGLGAMLYEAISGRKPFVHENLGKLLGMQLKTQPTKLSELASGVTQALETLVESCLAPAPGERPASAVLARRLTVLAAELATGPTPGAARATAAVRSAGAPGDSGIRKAPANPTMALRSSIRSATPRPVSTTRAVAAQPAPGWRHPRRTIVAAVAALAFGALVWISIRPSGRPTATGRETASPAPVVTETAPPIERITTGVDRAWVRLAAGAAGNLEASFTPAGDSAERTVAVSSGQRDIRLEGLSALTSYDLRIGRGPAARRSRFQTLEKGPGSFIRLTERRFEARGLELRSGPGCVGAIWRQSRPGRGQQIRFSQSFDGGQTWTASEAAGDVKSSTSWPSLERAATGFVAAWRETSRGSGCKVEVRARPDATGRWESLGGFGSSEHEPALAVGGDDALELLAWRPARGHAAEGIDWRRIDRARNTSGPAARAGSLVHQHAFVRCCQAVRLGGLLCCFYTSLVSPTELQGLTIAGVGSIDPALPELRWISSSMPEKGIWSAPQAIAPINEKFRGTPEVRALANRLVVCYEAGDEVACRVLLVPGQPPGAAVNPFGAKHPGECPSLFRSGGSLRLAALARVAGSGRGGTAASTDLLEAVSPDGVHWRPAGQRRLTGPRLSALRVAASESGTVALGVDEEGALFVLR